MAPAEFPKPGKRHLRTVGQPERPLSAPEPEREVRIVRPAPHRPQPRRPLAERVSSDTTDERYRLSALQGIAAFAKAGPAGPAGGELQLFEFDTPSSEWVCVHGLGRLPLITVYDIAGNLRPFVPAANPDSDTTVLTPNPPLAGKVVIS